MSHTNHLPLVINHIEEAKMPFASYTFATRNQDKLKEFARILKTDVVGKDLKVSEIQDEDAMKVLEQKAKDAWVANNGEPIVVEDSALLCKALDNLPGTFADQFTNTFSKRETLCRMLDRKDRSVIFQVGIAFFDGFEVHTRVGQTFGTIADHPKGTKDFGFGDIFIPEGSPKTFAEMEPKEKDSFSPRRIALEKLLKDPFVIGHHVYQLPEPYDLQSHEIQLQKLQHKKALEYAYNLECLEGNKANKQLTVSIRKPYHEIRHANGQVKRYVPNKDSASLGIILTPWDTAFDLHDHPLRLQTDQFHQPVFWQMGNESVKMALAARAAEFLFYHNDEMYAYIRALMNREMKTTPRSNKRSPVIEELLKIVKQIPMDTSGNDTLIKAMNIIGTAAISELGYARKSSERTMSRTVSMGKGLILNATGIPSSVFALGGMPPTTGWRDVLVTSALSFMRSYIPRNSIYADNIALQIKLFQQAREQIYRLELPKDIETLVVKQIGIAAGVENPQKIAEDAYKMYQAGCSSIRFYSTNPDKRMIDVTKAVRQRVGEDMTLCVGPIVDVNQAQKLIHPDSNVNILLAGHGGGENCTSLAGGGSANSLELLYTMSLNDTFNQTAIGLEGGTGNAIGAILGMVDVISLNKRGVNGGIETGGLFVEHVNGRVCQPYHGSASPITQWIESACNPDIARKRLNDTGKLRNVEGKANYMFKSRSVNSIVDNFQEARMFAGRALADQDASSIYELRENIKKYGHKNHRIVSNAAAYVAAAHRESK